MKKLYKKSRLAFAIIWIVAYCVLMSIGDSLSENVGVSKSVTLPIALTMSVILLIFIKRNGLSNEYGLCKSKVSARKMLFYFPLIILPAANIFCETTSGISVTEAVLYILTMLCVGFLEEIIFRGLLFKSMAVNGIKSAIAVSSITFGMGHIINLINGSGAELLPNILQVIYATAAGFMLVMIFHKTGSLLPCIVFHGLFNALSVFADENALTINQRIISCAFLVAVSSANGVYIALKVKKK